MQILIKECGNLLKWLEEQRSTAQLLKWLEEQKDTAKSQPEVETQIYRNMMAKYQRVLFGLEQSFKAQSLRKYLEIRRARYAVWEGMEMTISLDILYTWMVQNICDLEDEE